MHVNETVRFNEQLKQIEHLPQSSLMLMKNNKIPRVFDLCVSGDGEYLIEGLGTPISRNDKVVDYLQSNTHIMGDWIASYLHDDHVIDILDCPRKVGHGIMSLC